jgi:hypothetical protein
MNAARRALVLLLLAALLACSPRPPSPSPQRLEPEFAEWSPPGAPARAAPAPAAPREPCAHRSALRNAYFGDLHVHTALSMDASMRGALATPDDAYRFARGEPLELAPASAGGPRRMAQLERPLDFAAVTDHAEWLGEVSLCTRWDSPLYDSRPCRVFRGEADPAAAGLRGMAARMSEIGGRPEAVCGPDAVRCRSELASVWQETVAAAQRWYDTSSACRFTTFAAWEYSASPQASKVHRNVILRSEIVPELPISWLDEPSAEGLWRKLRERCNDTASGCEALAIPHNPNLSNGRTFALPYRDAPLDEQRERAALRAQLEPLVEMMQTKGESECRRGMFDVVGDPDELCDFEKVRGLGDAAPADCREGTGAGALLGRGCESRLDFARYALIEGLREEARIGINPFRFGLIGSTDTHNGTPGDVAERSYQGANATGDGSLAARLAGNPGGTQVRSALRNPGGLMGVWAEENSRDALFDAMKRRETFATSGPRIAARFFGGWSYDAGLCERSDLVEQGYASGVPMGGVLGPRPQGGAAPVFVVSALRHPGTASAPGGLLQRIQIIKGWAGDDGRFRQRVYDVAGDARNGADIDHGRCEPRGRGAEALCAVWRDAEFDAGRAAVYYARIVENPSCRWNAIQCAALPAQQRPAGCSDPTIPKVIQERAWTSPIWYAPTGPGPS